MQLARSGTDTAQQADTAERKYAVALALLQRAQNSKIVAEQEQIVQQATINKAQAEMGLPQALSGSFQGTAQAFRDSVDLAKSLEASGYQRVWYAEHHNMPAIASTTPASQNSWPLGVCRSNHTALP